MRLERELDEWVAAGLISAEQARRIASHAAARRRPWGLWAAIGLGGLAIVAGVLSVVAANWAGIPDGVKLALHFALNLAAAAGLLAAIRADRHAWIELFLFLSAGLVMTGIALVGQVFQLSSDLWKPFATWLVLTTPLLLIGGRGTLTALSWSAILVATLVTLVGDFEPWLDDHRIVLGIAAACPGFLAILGHLGLGKHERSAFWTAMRETGIFLALGVASLLPTFVWHFDAPRSGEYSDLVLPMLPGLLPVAVASVALLGWRPGGARSGAVALAAATVAAILPAILPLEGMLGAFTGSLAFIGLWGAAAAGALHDGRIVLFRAAVGLIAARIVILYFEAIGSLTETGFGLITGGILAIVITMVTVRVLRRVRPEGRAA
jgi:uncharacterized membrane protein